MRRLGIICLLAVVAVLFSSCERRPFSQNNTAVNFKLNINTEINTGSKLDMPDMMRVDLFDINTGNVVYTDYISPKGGYIYPRPGKYDLLVYNIDTESTIIKNEDNIGTVEAYTNEISAYLKSQIEQFLKNRAEHYQKARTKAPLTKDPILEGTERIVNEPDHLWVGEHKGIEIPAFEIGMDNEIHLEVDAHTIVENWKIKISPVQGLKWVSSITALITGQTASTYIGQNVDSDGVVTILFPMGKDEENGMIIGSFNTFGKNPLYSSWLSLDLNIVDNMGDEHHFHFDLTDQFFENNEFTLVVDNEKNPIVIEEPKVAGGGFSPTVSDWNEIKTEIQL